MGNGSRRWPDMTLICTFFFTVTVLLIIPKSSSLQFISTNQSITDAGNQTIVSSPGKFKLGFFSPENSTDRRYVGVWFNNVTAPITASSVWVANGDNPLRDTSGVLKIADDGNLVIVDGRKKVIWSSNVTSMDAAATSSRVAELLDTGNLVLRETINGRNRTLWESFAYPSNVFLPNMRFGVNTKTREKLVITSWKDTENDPSTGNYTLELDPTGVPQSIIMDNANGNQRRHWRSGPWNNRIFIGIPTMSSTYLNGFNILTDNNAGTVYLTLVYSEVRTILQKYTVTSDGNFVETHWNETKKQWVKFWSAQDTECDMYAKCGPFGSCNVLDSPICSCLRGFVPKSVDEWSNGNWTGGCVRRTELQCQRSKNETTGARNESSTVSGGIEEADGFLTLERMKVPDFVERLEAGSAEECGQRCLQNCSCLAYASESNIGCMWWSRDLIDVQKFSNFTRSPGVNLYIKVAHSELDKIIPGTKKNVRLSIIIPVVIAIVLTSLCTLFCWRRMAKQRAKNKNGTRLPIIDRYGDTSDKNMFGDNPELAMFTFDTLSVATNNFSWEAELGHGGFGSVYKAKLMSGLEVAVKRLSQSSGQGLEEFKNEVVVISKLQHRNLVRLLGCCIEGEEKILIYEYMPNKSLDAFLFGTSLFLLLINYISCILLDIVSGSDPAQRALLNWRKCFEIIEGITRGILYLHRDSRLRVIHRDLKASNVLLDENLYPKISDFGMARIFGGDELQADTRRVVGTYGYMSPEYAMEGRFSEKSDVFSFGVLLIEIVSGKKCTSFHLQELSLSLLGYAWKLWNENMVQKLIDPTLLSEKAYAEEILKCIHVGLLCVQESPKDRPNMSTVLSILTSETTNLPVPKQPAYVDREASSISSGSLHKTGNLFSVNHVTITSIDGR
ncbi:G-type lectin S-receptor-like serine/threonine-protein kinase At1g11300 isoform X2 [Papaver somniferum]|uniref:G-type lectin S-receptor-like serine/threonine-protein kinase At1g11300 isoform X2 n=1 Tax=Papaver somniferum TaxID=3469 RepID=UPI000E700109|nr:G-type lectin S-receptor-like serine/threonine-protein kinase At1g11300 isoform X2 [Papaver somniferum]